jgi:chaperonin GroES
MSTALKTQPAIKTKPSIRIHPLEDRVVIRAFEESEPMHGRLYIPDTAKEKPTRGEVIAVGPGRTEKGERVPVGVAVGEVVIYGTYSGTPFQIDDEELLIVKASDILARIG